MSSIGEAFSKARAVDRAVLIPYLMTGYPERGSEVELAQALERGGADIIEVGMPFSDPLADGPTIQRAGQGALANGVTVETCIDAVRRLRQSAAVPLVLMGYYNPVYHYGVDRFMADASRAGVSGLILPDLPPGEAADVRAAASDHGIDLIFLLAPTSTDRRIETVTEVASGFIYCVSLTGVTGARDSVSAGLEDFLGRVRRHTDLPLAVGFGISRPEHVERVSRVADGVVVASALIDLIDNTAPSERAAAVEGYVRTLRAATRRSVAGVQTA